MNPKSSNTPTFLSLFSGCGGFDDGFEQQGFTSLGAFDIDESAIQVYRDNLKGPITRLDLGKPENRTFDFAPGEVDILISGSPCQGFSTAGKRNVNDPRNKLLLVGGEVALRLNPKVFIAENVMGSLSGQHHKYWTRLDKALKKEGYFTRFLKINCKDIGLPQTRKRVLFFASKYASLINFEVPNITAPTLREAISNVEGLPNQNTYYDVDDQELKILKRVKSGQKLSNVRKGVNAVHTWDIPEVFGKVTKDERLLLETLIDLRRRLRTREVGDADPVRFSDLKSALSFKIEETVESLLRKGYLRRVKRRFDLCQTFNGLYRRLDPSQLSYTVDTRFGHPRYFVHPDQNRGFSVREAARIQGFRDSFIFSGSIVNQFRMIGNAVPPPLSAIIASILEPKLNGKL